MESLYLIGGSGFIGKNLALWFRLKFKVVIFDISIDYIFFAKYPEIETYKIDLLLQELPSLTCKPNYIINLSSIVTAERDFNLFEGLISSNLNVLLKLYNAYKDCAELRLFIQFGSSEEYGSAIPPFNEDMREKPNSPYALVKQLTVNTALMLHENYGFPAMIIRPTNLFGLFQSKLKFIPYVIEQLRENKPLNVSLCEQKRDFIYIDDFVSIVEKLINHFEDCRGRIVNVGSGYSISLKEVIEECKIQLNSSSKINYGSIPYRKNEIMNMECSLERLSNLIGEKVKCDFKENIKHYISAL